MDVFNFPKQWLLSCLTAGMLTHYALVGKSRRHPQEHHPVLLASLLGVGFFATVSSFLSETTLERSLFGYPGRANGLITYFCILLVIWVGANTVVQENLQTKVRNRVILVYLLFATYATMQLFYLDPVTWNNPYNRVIGTLGNPNFSGAFLGASSAVMILLAFHEKNRRRYLNLLVAIWLFILGVATESVQAFGIFVIGIVIHLLTVIYKRVSLRKFVFVALVFMLLGIGSLLSALGFGPLGASLYQYTLKLRIEYWRVGIEIMRESPLTGVGPDSFIEGFRLFREADFVRNYSESVIADSAHNVLINFGANFGIPALACYILVVTIVSVRAVKFLFSKESTPIVSRMIALSWLLLLIQSLFSLEQIGLTVFQWGCGALLLNRGLDSHIPSKGPSSGVMKAERSLKVTEGLRVEISILVLILAMISSWSLVKQEISLLKMAKITQETEMSEDQVQSLLSGFTSFTSNEIRRTIYVANFLLMKNRYGEAQVLLEKLVEKDPDALEALELLARLARYRADLNVEIRYRLEIEEIDPFNYSNLLSIAQSFRDTGDFVQSKEFARKVLKLTGDPQIIESATALVSLVD